MHVLLESLCIGSGSRKAHLVQDNSLRYFFHRIFVNWTNFLLQLKPCTVLHSVLEERMERKQLHGRDAKDLGVFTVGEWNMMQNPSPTLLINL